jgi:hypothetical protein
MSNASNYLEQLFANFFAGENITGVTAYAALFDGNPGEDGTGALEVTTDIRPAGRLPITFGTPVNGVIKNSADVDFGLSAGAATVAGFALFDEETSGNVLVYQGATPVNVGIGDAVSFKINNITITVQ